MFLNLMAGLGDTIYVRPIIQAVVRDHPRTIVRTSWPQLIRDVAYPILQNSQLRTQAKNIARGGYPMAVPVEGPSLRPRYGPRELGSGLTILEALERTSGVRLGDTVELDLPKFPPVFLNTRKPVAVIRPASLRREWPNVSRNPLPRYLRLATHVLRARGFHVVSVADISPPHEVRVGDVLPADEWFDQGELVIEELVGLVQRAAIVVGGVGWIVPMCLATRTPVIVVGGGQGAFCAPDVVIDPRVESGHVRFIEADHPCRCKLNVHGCRKKITDFRGQFTRALDELHARRRAA